MDAIEQYASDFEKIILQTDDFPVDFDAAWQWIGYTGKHHAQEMLEKNFISGEEFSPMGVKTSGEKGGRPATHIMLTVDCFKAFCMLAQTERGKEVRRYFIACERRLHRLMAERYQQQEVTGSDRMVYYNRLIELEKICKDAQAEMQSIRSKMGNTIHVGAEYFTDWAEQFFTSDRLNCKLQRNFIYEQCLTSLPVGLTPQRFRVLLEGWCWLRGYTLNPPVLQNPKQGRILEKVRKLVQLENGQWHQLKRLESVEMYYIQTRPLLPQNQLFNN